MNTAAPLRFDQRLRESEDYLVGRWYDQGTVGRRRFHQTRPGPVYFTPRRRTDFGTSKNQGA